MTSPLQASVVVYVSDNSGRVFPIEFGRELIPDANEPQALLRAVEAVVGRVRTRYDFAELTEQLEGP